MIIVVLMFILWQARLPLWNNHLQVDIWVWWERVDYWRQNLSFAGMEGNEILPLTLIYLFVPILLVPVGWLSYANYLPASLFLNLSVIGLHLIFVKRKTLFLLSLLFLGPILLFRFDALVTLLLILSFVSFQKNRPGWSGFCLGLATGMKVFPVIVLPYLLMILIKQKQLKSLLLLLIYFGEALLLPVLIFFLLGGNWQQIIGALNFHNLKLISIESLPGSFITGWSLITTGQPPPLLAGYGIWAIPGPAALFNRLWVVPIGLVYYFIWNQRSKYFNWSVPLALMLVFLVFSKNLNPQYIWWFMALLPFVKAGRAIWVLTLAVALLNQLVYPIFYTTLIEEFYQKNSSYWIYYLLLLRNLGITALAYLSLKTLYPDSSKIKGKLALK
ncbi:DUF2029 domain-containing protein [Patescibacteria group bacterium]|nr:DUF2029 domain-containing protein [Patescibacteria group bacterium]